MASSVALAMLTCASCAEAVPLRSHCLLSINKFDSQILTCPDLACDEDLLVDRFKWLHSDCVPLPTDDVSFYSDDPPVLSLCSVCHSSVKNNKLPQLSLANKLFSVGCRMSSRI
ncbi:hypothetical protein B0H19DRAFT_687188 [Mycena capillaripes]|nr:hypothetical protein B0H19DRAFT_687188 [Mycena capillaripes]